MPRPDEGLIHAWLDGQLPADEAARIEQLVATDPAWAEAVAEARGLVAAASRIVSALDHVPAGVIPKGASSRASRRLPWWSKAAAAVVLVVGGSVVVMQRAPAPMTAAVPVEPGDATAAPFAVAPSPSPSPAPASVPAPARTPTPTPTNTTIQSNSPKRAVSATVERTAGSVKAAVPAEADARRNTVAAAPPPTLMANVPSIDAQLSRARADSTLSAERDAGLRARDVRQLAGAGERAAADAALPRTFAARTAEKSTANAPIATLGATSAAVAAAAPAAAPSPQARRVSGVVGGAAVASPMRAATCYRVRDDSAASNAGVVMRAVRSDGDTLRLESAQGASALRAWVVWRDGVGRGAMVVAADGRGAVAVVATPVACPTP